MINWNVSPDIIAMGDFRIRWYGLLFLAGFYLGLFFMKWVCKNEGKPHEKLESLLVYLILGTTLGARIGHCLFYEPSYYLQNPIEIFYIWKGGLASHGGGLGVITALFLFSKYNPEFSFMWLLDRIAIPTALTGSFIRIGNLMNSEIIGKATDGTWGFIFKRIDEVPRHPTQIYESLCYFINFLVLFFIYRKYKHQPPAGLIFGSMVTITFVARIAIELFKENQESFEADMFMNMGQILSLPYLAVGLYLIYRALKLKKITRS